MTERRKKPAIPSLTPSPAQTNRQQEFVQSNEDFRREILRHQSLEMKLDEFEVYETIGKGQYGEVKKVKYKPTGQIMAMKVINFASSGSTRSQMIRELQVLKESRSSHIISFYGVFLVETQIHFCMEFMEYGSLDKLSKNGVPEIVLAKIALPMIEGLKYMKDVMNKMHRDVKPTNILANHRGEIKLCDFGIVAELQQSVASSYIGCSMYMAPERINTTESSQGYGVYSDVWSVGITLIEIAHGVFPFPPQKNIFDQLNVIVSGDPPQLNSTFSPQARDFISKCLQKDYRQRATYDQLLQHEFINMYRNQNFDMPAWMKEASESNQAQSLKK